MADLVQAKKKIKKKIPTVITKQTIIKAKRLLVKYEKHAIGVDANKIVDFRRI